MPNLEILSLNQIQFDNLHKWIFLSLNFICAWSDRKPESPCQEKTVYSRHFFPQFPLEGKSWLVHSLKPVLFAIQLEEKPQPQWDILQIWTDREQSEVIIYLALVSCHIAFNKRAQQEGSTFRSSQPN